jgi:hypothetical protein
MAQASGNFGFTGSLSNLSAYKMRGFDKVILRTKGGASKRRIRYDPGFVNTRRNNAEFGGRATAAKWIRRVLYPLKQLADHNLQPELNSRLKPIQEMDTQNIWGERNILLSKDPRLLEGYDLNGKILFDSVVRSPVVAGVSRIDLHAQLTIPALAPGINFYEPWSAPVYSFIATLGIIPDLVYNKNRYIAMADYMDIYPRVMKTGWFPSSTGSPASVLELKLDMAPPDDLFSVMLAVGIQFGIMKGDNKIEPLKYAGSAKVLAMR